MVFENILDQIFWPILKLPPVFGLILISFVISLIVTIVYKYTTDQTVMKSLREEMKEHQKKAKELRNDPKKVIESQKKAMEANMQYMMRSFKPTLFTIVPIIIIFGWLSSHYGYYPLEPNMDFNFTVSFESGSTGKVELIAPDEFEVKSEKVQDVKNENYWTLNTKKEGKYTLQIKYLDKYHTKDIIITTEELKYTPVNSDVKDNHVKDLVLGNRERFSSLSFWVFPGWVVVYIIFSMIFSFALRKAFKLH